MKRSLAGLLMAVALLAGPARAETLHNGRVYQTTADHLIKRLGLTCKPVGAVQSVTLPDGSTALIRAKVCQ